MVKFLSHSASFLLTSSLLTRLRRHSILGAIQPWAQSRPTSGVSAEAFASWAYFLPIWPPSPGHDSQHTDYNEERKGTTACARRQAGSQSLASSPVGARDVLYVDNVFKVGRQIPDMATLTVSKSKEIQIVSEKRDLQQRQNVIRVYAYFVGRKIDLVGVSSDSQIRNARRASGRDHVIVEFQGKGKNGGSAHLVVYKYGSIVLFNAPTLLEQHQELMQFCQRHTSEPILQPHHEVQSVVVVPQMTNWYKQEGDRIKVKELDLDNMRVISSVLGQSVALDQYSRQIDRALGEFNSINREMERTGSFTITRQELFRLVARNNMMITEAILVLGLLDRSDTAWTNDKYYGVWSMMQSEYELAQRFEAMDKKLSLIQESAKYFLQILQDNKSVTLEWFIIILITAELVVGVYDIVTRH